MICLSSSGANVFVHVCGEKINNLSFSVADANCGMEKMYSERSINNTQKEFIAENNCCKNYLLKNNLKVRSAEKIDTLDLLLTTLKVSDSSSISNFLLPLDLNVFDNIILYNRNVNSIAKNGIYLLLQNFRN